MNRKDIPVLSGLFLLTFVLVAPTAAQQPPVTPVAPVGAAVPGVAPAIAPAAAYNPSRVIKMHPDEKRPLLLTERERNPYARRSPDASPINENGENEEEIQIRQSLTSLSVTGQVRGGSNGLRVLLGDIILEKGRILPQLLPEQSENLQVVEVTEENVVFAWLDIETGEPTGKTMQLPYDVSPQCPVCPQRPAARRRKRLLRSPHGRHENRAGTPEAGIEDGRERSREEAPPRGLQGRAVSTPPPTA